MPKHCGSPCNWRNTYSFEARGTFYLVVVGKKLHYEMGKEKRTRWTLFSLPISDPRNTIMVYFRSPISALWNFKCDISQVMWNCTMPFLAFNKKLLHHLKTISHPYCGLCNNYLSKDCTAYFIMMHNAHYYNSHSLHISVLKKLQCTIICMLCIVQPWSLPAGITSVFFYITITFVISRHNFLL